ncbi:DUF2785 domain-containing protein [Nocardioides sp. LHG3406-4]|uniref:DUF2785 domain-containing protein n=1 Tax=Nocardioides sp. LHG3406-4 TaxID=2804575 RepID=UPI003CEFB64E
MATAYWQQVLSKGLTVPTDRPLDDLTAELATMLGSPDPALRDGIAYPAMATWIGRGVYDDLLVGLGDGMATGLGVGLGERGTDTVFRRSFSALVLAEVIDRDNIARLVPAGRVMDWADRIVAWYLREQDLRGYVPGAGWAHAAAHGADAIGVLAKSPHIATPELTVLLDVIADRVISADVVLLSGEPDRMASAVLAVLRRDQVPLKVIEPWIARIAGSAGSIGNPEDRDPYLGSANPQALLRALYLQVELAADPPPVRADLLLVLVDALRATNPFTLAKRRG